jgi:predicted Rossmann fold flavoprotein
MMDWVVIGGGAAGMFAALTAQRLKRESRSVLLERTNVLLTKVRISGGGRCNVTHHLFEPRELIRRYPRGAKELMGAFHRFQPQDTIDWFGQRGVKLIVEPDGRMFPSTHSSETIAQALLTEAQRLRLPIRLQTKIRRIQRSAEGFRIELEDGEALETRRLLLATGGSREGQGWAAALGHTIVTPVPSLFTFNVPSSALKALSGVALERAQVELEGSGFREEGPLLITHFGFSGPAVLRLSAFGARWLAERSYQATLLIGWVPELSEEQILQQLQQAKVALSRKELATQPLFDLPASLWRALVPEELRWQHAPVSTLRQLAQRLKRDRYTIEGKTTHKDEFVTAGGVSLSEVDFKTMESRICPGLFFAGEVLDVDGITGGFNFQNAWTTGYLAGHGMLGILPT